MKIDSANNFDFLKHHDEILVRLAQTGEVCFVPDPKATLIKMRQLGEAIAKAIASRVWVNSRNDVKPQDSYEEPTSELLKRIKAEREAQKLKKKTRSRKVNT